MKHFSGKKLFMTFLNTFFLVFILVVVSHAQYDIPSDVVFENNQVGANLEAIPIAGKAPLEVNFKNGCEGIPNYFIWDYGDGLVEYLRQGWPTWTDPYHFYMQPGEYDVSLTAWGNRGFDAINIPNLIYVDAEYEFLPLKVEASGATFPGEDWSNAVDHDVWGVGSVVAAVSGDAWAMFSFLNAEEMDIYKIRLLTDTAMKHKYITNLVRDFEIWTSVDSVDFELAFQGTSDKLDGEWDLIEFEEPIRAKYILLTLNSSRGENAQYCEIAEFQILGSAVESLAKPLAALGTKGNQPGSFRLGQNYPNPFNPHTIIPFEISETAEVTLSIYDIQGRLVRQLLDHEQISGRVQRKWDGTNDAHQPVAAGVYVYRLTAVGADQRVSLSKKMILMK